MLDLFSIFSKGGIVLWCFQSTSEIFSPSVNGLIRSVILQERTGNNSYNHNALTLQYKLDNEFELVFVVAYQRILQLSYIDKFLNDVHLEFRDKYKNELQGGKHVIDFDFKTSFDKVLRGCELWAKSQAKIPKQMRTFEDSQKSKKTVASMIERKGEEKGKKSVKIVETKNLTNGKEEETPEVEEDVIAANRARLAQKIATKNKKEPKKSPKSPPAKVTAERVKAPRVWELGGDARDLKTLDFSTDKPGDDTCTANYDEADAELVGQMAGAIRDLEVDSEDSDSEEDDEEEEEKTAAPKKTSGMFNIFKGLVGSKALSEEVMRPVLDQLRDHLIGKNVASDIANKLCDSVSTKLEGKVLGTFDTVARTIKASLTESLMQLLSPKRRVDILRDCLHAREQGRPYVMTFCGVNGVGKSTNLAKICFWLIENNLSVLVAACDTFRAGAVEQLRTHVRRLNALHPPAQHTGRTMVQLYEKGYAMTNKVSNDQMEALLDFLTEHPTIAKGVGLGARSKVTIDKQWNDLAKKLNSFGNGSTKSGERWKKYWVDLKHKSKTKLSKRKREALGTGGGPSSQGELSELEKKILAIIGEQAVFGDSVHKVPVFNIETERNEEGERVREIMAYSQEIITNDSATENLPEVVDSLSGLVHSPSRRGHTSQVYSTIEYDPTVGQHSITDTTVRETPLQTGMESPVTRPIADRRRLRASRNRQQNTTIPSRINPEWVMDLEKSRVEADTKLANAALIIAESARVHAETARAQADLTSQLVAIVRQQSDDIKALLVMLRDKQQ